MRIARIRCDAPHLQALQLGPLAFGSTWWSPQPGLAPPQCIVRHPNSGCAVVADARLDNPAELRAKLKFPAASDDPDAQTDHSAAIILRAWLRWGEDCVDHIDGDFAFAIYDSRQQRLFLARDRMGERPLYVHHVPGKLLVFGTTSHSVLAHPRVPQNINEARIADYLLECAGGGLEGVDFTSTFHLAVERHPPRHVRVVGTQGARLRQYWTLEPGRAGPLPKNDGEWVEAISSAMERSVEQRLAGPQRGGSMLSGGLDSTSLAIIAAEQLQTAGHAPLPTFSAIDSSRPDCLETQAVRIATEMPIFNPTLIDIANLGYLRPELECFLDEFDEPFDANMSLVDAQYAAAAKIGVDGIIDGANGDLLFVFDGSICRQIRSVRWNAAWRNAGGLTRGGGSAFGLIRNSLRTVLVPDALRRCAAPLRARLSYKTQLGQSFILPAFASRIGLYERRQDFKSLRSAVPLREPSHECSEVLLHTFPVVAAERYHRVAARHGITKLAPFSERRLLELCIHLPDRQRLRDGWTKDILRLTMQGRMPESVRLRSDKQHLGGRMTARLLEGRSLPHTEELTSNPRLNGYLDVVKIASLDASSEPTSVRRLNAAMLAHWVDM